MSTSTHDVRLLRDRGSGKMLHLGSVTNMLKNLMTGHTWRPWTLSAGGHDEVVNVFRVVDAWLACSTSPVQWV